MNHITLMAAAGIIMASCSGGGDGEVTIRLPEDYNAKFVVVTHATINNIVTARQEEDLKVTSDTLEVNNGVARMKLDASGPSYYSIEPPAGARMIPEFYAAPGEHLEVTVTAFDPLDYAVSGTPLMDDITYLAKVTAPIKQELQNLYTSEEIISEQQAQEIMNRHKEITDRYDAAIKQFVADHPGSPAVPFAIMDLSGDDFKAIYDRMTPEARKSILMPYAEIYNDQAVEAQQMREAAEAKQAQLASGTIEAPGFTLPDLAGKQVSLSDFRGKWVVLDFWGSWCGWCIKGFPALKEAYEKYGSRITVIGIGCNEPEADWRAGVKKYELPWINLYNGDNREIYTAYSIEGFPTKVIINPEGKIVDLTTGEDPEFFTRLADLVK